VRHDNDLAATPGFAQAGHKHVIHRLVVEVVRVASTGREWTRPLYD
jgi:hypothetical protein